MTGVIAVARPLPAPVPQLAPDAWGRVARKLRVSLVDACNFRCFYCMPANPVFTPPDRLLPAAEIVRLAGELAAMGITQLRLTGGEPTLRSDFAPIVHALSKLPLERLGLTTNGWLLGDLLDLLAGSACRHVNVSLDSLRADRFERITGKPYLDRVRRNLLAARDRGLLVKVNVVVARGINDDELLDLVDFSARERVPVRFLELMRIGPRHHEHGERFVSAEEMLRTIGARYPLEPVAVEPDSTAFAYRTAHGAELGFIASESRPFCAACSRLRLSATGQLRACLMDERGVSVRGLPGESLARAVREVVAMKPAVRPATVEEAMYRIGG